MIYISVTCCFFNNLFPKTLFRCVDPKDLVLRDNFFGNVNDSNIYPILKRFFCVIFALIFNTIDVCSTNRISNLIEEIDKQLPAAIS